jgi:GntR family transcriptional regulator
MVDPMYRRIAEDLRRHIESGELPRGAQLPTELELREQYEASRNTIRDAIKWLTTRSLVETRPGQGTFVVQTIVPFITTLTGDPEAGEQGPYLRNVKAKLRSPEATPPRVEIQVADPDQHAELRPEAGATVVSRHQQYRIDGTPWSLQTSFYPLSLVERGATRLIAANDITEGAVEYLRETVGIKQVGYRDTITVRAPDGPEARFFGLADDGRVSVIETRRTAFDAQGVPVRLTVSVYPADRNQLAVNVGAVPPEVADPPQAELDQPAVTPEGDD